MLLEGAECPEILISCEQAVFVTTDMQEVVVTPDSAYVRVARDEVDENRLVCLEFLVLLGCSLKLFAQPCAFLFMRFNLALK